MSALFEPPPSDEAAPFWDATRRAELVLPWCAACDRPFWYPRAVCPRCLGDDIEWRSASGEGVVYAASVQHLPGPGRDAADGPYVVVLVDLAEGVRVMGNVLGLRARRRARGHACARHLASALGRKEAVAVRTAGVVTGVKGNLMPMEIELGPAAAEFRAEVREWLHENRPDDPEAVRSQLIGGGPEHDAWAARLHDAGFLCVGWPKEYGGRGLSGIEVAVMNEEFGRAGIPRVRGRWANGSSGRRSSCTAPTNRRRTSCPRIVDGTDRYCQGFSEPDAGSDLAGLKTRGVVDGDEIVVTGPEGMDLRRAPGQHDVLSLPYRSRRAEAPRHLVRAVADEAVRRIVERLRAAPDPPDHGQ